MSHTLVVVTAGLSQPSSTRLLADQIADAVTVDITPFARDLLDGRAG